jgi:predicted anti-sigma-YlaC factor YlaD
MSATDKNCIFIQDLLIKKDFAELAAHESETLIEHLQQCEACRAFQQVLLNVQQAIQPAAEEILIPHPAIRQNLRNRLRRAQPARQASIRLREIWGTLLNILKLKIPVYQAVLGTAIIFAVFIGIDKLNARGEREMLQRLLNEQNGKQALAPSEAPHHIAQIDSQKIGRSVAEDSLLMKFMVTAM